MKTDSSIKKNTIASINRSVMNPEGWIYSKVCTENKLIEFDFQENELPIFEINSFNVRTIITTRRIIEKEGSDTKFVKFEDIDKVIYGDFKGVINEIQLSTFGIIDVLGVEYNFQMETGKASIGLIKTVNTVLKLKSSNNLRLR